MCPMSRTCTVATLIFQTEHMNPLRNLSRALLLSTCSPGIHHSHTQHMPYFA